MMGRRLAKRKGTKKIALFVGLVLAFVCCGCGSAGKTAEAVSEDLPKIIVGSDNYPPYNYENSNGEPTGIDVELAKEAFHRMGLSLIHI